jgi:glycosyltransferase involved in cell wall biosynthesis
MASARPLRVLGVIARLSLGGAPVQATLISGRLDPDRFESILACGAVPDEEASMLFVAARERAPMVSIPGLGPRIRPLSDIRALLGLVRLVRRFRPDVVHTHTAKAGFLGRLAALSIRPRPVLVHTYHGHVLDGYYGPFTSLIYRLLERAMSRLSDCLIAPSRATVDELVQLEVAPRERFAVIPLGLDLKRFAAASRDTPARLREELGVGDDELLCAFAGRIVKVKRLDVLLRAIADTRGLGIPVRLAVTGDGELRASMERLATDLELAGAVSFLGVRDDPERVIAAADIAVLTSDREGTPIALIEAAAASRPAIATDVGGVRDVVTPQTGILVPAGDHVAFGRALSELAASASARSRMGDAARAHAFARFSAERLIDGHQRLYEELVRRRRGEAPKRRTSAARPG